MGMLFETWQSRHAVRLPTALQASAAIRRITALFTEWTTIVVRVEPVRERTPRQVKPDWPADFFLPAPVRTRAVPD